MLAVSRHDAGHESPARPIAGMNQDSQPRRASRLSIDWWPRLPASDRIGRIDRPAAKPPIRSLGMRPRFRFEKSGAAWMEFCDRRDSWVI